LLFAYVTTPSQIEALAATDNLRLEIQVFWNGTMGRFAFGQLVPDDSKDGSVAVHTRLKAKIEDNFRWKIN